MHSYILFNYGCWSTDSSSFFSSPIVLHFLEDKGAPGNHHFSMIPRTKPFFFSCFLVARNDFLEFNLLFFVVSNLYLTILMEVQLRLAISFSFCPHLCMKRKYICISATRKKSKLLQKKFVVTFSTNLCRIYFMIIFYTLRIIIIVSSTCTAVSHIGEQIDVKYKEN